jgi:uncharacterized protein YegP (UPF0339 family)
MKTAVIEVYTDKLGKFRFNVKSKNGEVVAVSEAYESKQSALGTARRLGSIVSSAQVIDMEKAAKDAQSAALKAAKAKK